LGTIGSDESRPHVSETVNTDSICGVASNIDQKLVVFGRVEYMPWGLSKDMSGLALVVWENNGA